MSCIRCAKHNIFFNIFNHIVLNFFNSQLSGHCVEFNVRGGVIQDQLSAPCNATFPKCDDFYLSSEVYKCKVTKLHIICIVFILYSWERETHYNEHSETVFINQIFDKYIYSQ